MSCKEIVQHSQLNNSTSKQLYSFGHQERFKKDQYKPLNDKIYDIKRDLNKRGTSFGYGEKFDIQKHAIIHDIPAPNKYNFKEEFSSPPKGPTMGISRDDVKFNSIMKNLNESPAPGRYNHPSTLSNIQYSMRQRTLENMFDNKKKEKEPGPGRYNTIISINQTGKFPVSKFKSYGVAVINPPPQGPQNSIVYPGPGQYDHKNEMGKAISSQYTDRKGLLFPNVGRQQKKVTQSLILPGPGHYRGQSDFGLYEQKII